MADPDEPARDEPTRARLREVLGCDVPDLRRIGGQHGVDHYRLVLADGRSAFAKVAAAAEASADAGFAAEATSLRWLGDARAVPVPEVLGVSDKVLVLAWVPEDSGGTVAASCFGADLARLHEAGAEQFGAPWPGVIAGLPLPNDESSDWPPWFAACRLLPYARIARDRGGLTAADVQLVESVASKITELAGPAEPPSRIHGDCWSGNVLWSGGRGWLIDPTAHGGHRETDLAMLSLFGAPHLDHILAAYQQARPLADGWRGRVPLHQLHPLLVHVCLFGAAYRESALAAARAALRA
jgi:fructosamine-3-kinase